MKELFEIKPLEWDVLETMVRSKDGRYAVIIQSAEYHYFWWAVDNKIINTCDSIAHGKQLAEDHHREQLLNHLKPVEWMPIETAPKDWSSVILFTPEFGEVAEGFFACEDGGDNRWHHSTLAGIPIEPTHWMPLPEPPKEKKG